MKDAMNVLLTRRSIRSYKSDPVPEEIVEKIIEAGLYAPTGMGLQDPVIIAVTNKEMRDKIAKENAAVMERCRSLLRRARHPSGRCEGLPQRRV